MSPSYVIIGDGIAGSTAAEELREQDPEAEITVITDEGEPLYNRILIKEYAKGKMPEGPVGIHEESWYGDRDIDLQMNTLVTSVDEDAHEVHTHEGATYEYDKLLVATGGTPSQLPVPGSDAEGIHHFWTFEDARGIRQGMEAADKAVIVGAGLLGIDLAAIAGAHDLEDAWYIMRGNRWWRYALSLEGAEIMHDWVGVGIGLNFNTELLQGTSVEVDDGIRTDEYMRTDAPDVYAAGDIVRFDDPVTGMEAQNGSWGSAKEQGSLAAQTMLADQGRDVEAEEFRWVSSYSITHFDFPFLSFGFPTEGDDEAERKYDETTWRRLTFKDGQLIGGVLIGDLAAQSKFKDLILSGAEVADQKDVLLQESFDTEDLDVDVELD